MARIRTIKPDFWADSKMARTLTRDQRLFYIALWNEADDSGRFLAHPRRLLGVMFPYDDDLTESFIEDSLRTLADTKRVVLYEVEGEPYGQLTKFQDHQRINRPTDSRIPPPDSDLSVITEPSLNPHGETNEPSTPPARGAGSGSGSGSGSGEQHPAGEKIPAGRGRKRNGRATWLTPYSDSWTERAGGPPNFGAMAQCLKPVEDEHGSDVALRAWTWYLDHTEPKFYSPASFASKAGHWVKESKPAFRGYA